ncbi:DNA polymerase III subunit epsilon [Pleomorphomonas diazotrophica]|uniref:DNA polymerase III subunit epsilon n=1 Tax=Pleomorphomonas diazotrophica TaxID=1166257 RepID=A0A1I4SWX3_9HYPH|nr:DNA polymerase III subunit epsilon [Pleomorphomonas diazotrophica]PKR88595.1 DNA polymerase III subunit epsilon [Pleomorphomonas diazotrophica]SFM68966.1 DNA polymerase III, epsilon subunit [Pleomorphomonas diazotrophica]
MREIVFDTETTGLDPKTGDRLVEIGCVEVVNRFPTGRNFHVYINPGRSVPKEAFDVHGLSDEFLADKPRFEQVADDFIAFVGEAQLVAHNASFDMGFINFELKASGRSVFGAERVIDTLMMARRKHPGAPASLDALCNRYGIDRSKRIKHGALLDAELLAEVYLELTGGRQAGLDLTVAVQAASASETGGRVALRPRPVPLPSRLSPAEADAHAAFIAAIGEKALWNAYSGSDERAETA